MEKPSWHIFLVTVGASRVSAIGQIVDPVKTVPDLVAIIKHRETGEPHAMVNRQTFSGQPVGEPLGAPRYSQTVPHSGNGQLAQQ